jgi:hypothetical protein
MWMENIILQFGASQNYEIHYLYRTHSNVLLGLWSPKFCMGLSAYCMNTDIEQSADENIRT